MRITINQIHTSTIVDVVFESHYVIFIYNFRYQNIGISKYQEHASDPYDRARLIRKKEAEISKANIKETFIELVFNSNKIQNSYKTRMK